MPCLLQKLMNLVYTSVNLHFRTDLSNFNFMLASAKGSSVGKHYSSSSNNSFSMKRALVVSKLSRYEFEQHRHRDLNEGQLESLLRNRGSDVDMLLKRHHIHKDFEKEISSILVNCGVETRVVNRFGLNEKNIEWADVIFAAGGDGTFLLAASRILGNTKPVIGLNSDPVRSEGHLCLPKKYSNNPLEAIQKLLRGEFKWSFRSRIRITLYGERSLLPPVELHEQELLEPQHRYFDTCKPPPSAPEKEDSNNVRVLPVLALNEVFIGENLSARVSYFEICLDGNVRTKVKSSGICVCTGTGSTSWHLSINRITQQSVAELAKLMGQDVDDSTIQHVTDAYNNNLVYSPEDKRMYYTIRDLISAGVWPHPKGIEPRGFASSLEIQSRCYEAGLVIDGGVSFHFDDGTTAILEINDSDALRTVILNE